MEKKAVVWGVDSNATVLQDKDVSNYAKIRKEAVVCVNAVRNEYEGAQLVVTANADIEYMVTLSDLTDQKGNVFSKENITAYHCKYTLVKHNIEKYWDLGVGYYPNALVPFEAIEKYNENKIEKGKNQTLYFVFFVPKDQIAGIYTGELTLSFDGQEEKVPVKIEVWDITLEDENHLRSLFLTDWSWDVCDPERKFETYDAFTKVLSEYRLSPITLIPYEDDRAKLPALYKFHADLAYEYAMNPRNTTFGVPYTSYSRVRTTEGGIKGTQSETDKGLDCDVFENYLVALIDKSLETKFNLYRKAVGHFGRFIDEPNGQGTMDRLEKTYNEYHGILDRLSEDLIARSKELQSAYDVSAEFVEELALSVKEMPHIITAHYDEKYDQFIDYYCPNWWRYQVRDFWKYHERQKERWWYGCNGPYSPLPSYHLDDTLLSPRLVSWMQSDYGYVGNLFWAVNYYAESTTDYYGYNVDGTAWGAANGDGLLMFPGQVYGLDKPTVSLRIEKIRDGMEEYELLRLLKLKYEEVALKTGLDISYENVLHHMSKDMYADLKIFASYNTFHYARKLLLELLLLANSPAKLCVKSLRQEGDSVCGEVYLAQGELLVNGKPCKMKTALNEGGVYEFTVQGNRVELSVPEYAEKSVCIKYLNSKIYQPDENLSKVFEGLAGDTEFSFEIFDKDEKYANAPTDTYAQFHLSTKGKNTLILKFKPEVLKTVGKNTDRIHFYFHNERPDGHQYELSVLKAKYEGAEELDLLTSSDTYLAPHCDTLVTIPDLSRKDWDKLKRIEYIQFEFGEENEEETKTRQDYPDTDFIYFGGFEIVEFTENK